MTRRLSILPFRLGATAATRLDARAIQFYRNTAEAFAGTAVVVDSGDAILTVPLNIGVLSDRPSDIQSRLGNALRALPSPDIVLLDLANPPSALERGQFEVQVALALDATLTDWARNGLTPLIILLRPELAPEGDVFRRILEAGVQTKRVMVVSDDGSVLCAGSTPPREFSGDKYRLGLAELRGSSLDLLRLKLIRRLGHFGRLNGTHHVRCVRYFFDASRAAAEIKSLFLEFLVTERKTHDDVAVVLDQQWAHWINEPVVSACLDSGSRVYALREGELPADIVPAARHLILVTPLVDSGDSLRRMVTALRARAPEAGLTVFAVLSTVGDQESMGSRTLEGDGVRLSISYLLRVTQLTWAAGDCPFCAMGVTADNPLHEPYLMLTSFDFWDMVNEAGVGPERNVPPGRTAKASVPQFHLIVRNHGSWLAQKMADLIERATERKVRDIPIICPAHEDASEALVAYLTLVAGASVIHIPREVIRAFGGLQKPTVAPNWTRWTTDRPDWFQRLGSILGTEVVILDEFVESGSTVHGLRRIAAQFGKDVACVVCLANFRPAIREELPFPCYALYEWESPRLPTGVA